MRSRRWRLWLAGFVVLVGLYGIAVAQGPKAFEVASIRPYEPGTSLRPSSRLTATRFEFVSVTPQHLLERAFDVKPFQIVVPEWAKQERFGVRAVLPPATTARDIPAMLHGLLVERSGLKMHVESRLARVYELVTGPSGPKMREVAPADDLGRTVDSDTTLISDRVNGLPGDERREITAAGTILPPRRISAAMQALLGRTPLQRSFGVDLSRSLEELGLKLEPKTSPVDFVVIDAIERRRPTDGGRKVRTSLLTFDL